MSTKYRMAVTAAILCCLPSLSFGTPATNPNQVFGNRGLAGQANTNTAPPYPGCPTGKPAADVAA